MVFTFEFLRSAFGCLIKLVGKIYKLVNNMIDTVSFINLKIQFIEIESM